jgi:hypothetical protein
MPPTLFGIDKARSLYISTKSLKLASIPPLDITDRISMLSVAAGLRPVGLLEAEGLQLSQVRDALIDVGIFTWIASSREGDKVLWLATNAEDRKRLKGTSPSEEEIGRSLSYPECCVQDNEVRNNVLYTQPDDAMEALKNVPRSAEKFLFVSHVACSGCLNSEESPTAMMNSQLSSLVQEIDSRMHEVALAIAEATGELQDEGQRSQTIQKIMRLHQSLFSGKSAI